MSVMVSEVPRTLGIVAVVLRSDVTIAFDEVCAVVVLSKNSVQVLGFVGQTIV